MQVKVTKIGDSRVVKISKLFPDIKVGDNLYVYRDEQLSLDERLKRIEAKLNGSM